MNEENVSNVKFYEKQWFLILCGVIFPPAGIALLWLCHKDMPQKKKYIYTAIMAVWFILAMVLSGGDSDETPAETKTVVPAVTSEAETTTTTTTTTTMTTTTTTQSMTVGEANAVKKAKSYLQFSAFSRKGLIEQLEFEGFTHEEAVYGADNCGADWFEQAAKKAKSYMEFSSFSKKGLIEQLEFEGFTHEQAVYGAESVGY